MAVLRYYNDGKGDYQSHELYLTKEIEVNPSGSYGSDLMDALCCLMGECVTKRDELNQLISDISTRKLMFVDEDDEQIEKERSTDYYTGEVTEKDIPFSMKHVITIENEVKTKFAKIRETINRYCTESSVGRWSKTRADETNKLLDAIVDEFLQIPVMIVVPYNRKLQLTWKNETGILFVLHITAAKIEFYMSFRNVFSKVPDSYIEVEKFEQVIFILKSFGLYRAK